MNSPASTWPLPPTHGWPPLRLWPLLGRHAVRATAELARARLRLRHFDARQLGAPSPAQRTCAAGCPRCAWIAYTLPRVARRLPFRADCLVQALAGQAWLAASGIASTIEIGVELPDGGPFGAHAWLSSGGMVICGGETARYTRLV